MPDSPSTRRVRNRGPPRDAPGLGLAEVGQPLVVDAHDFRGRLGIVEPAGGAQHAVEHFGLHAVAILVLHPQLGVGEPADALLAVVVEPGGGHAIGAMDLARYVLATGRAHAVDAPEVGTRLRRPHRPPRPVDDVGHALAQGRRSVLREEVGGEPAEIDVAVGGDHLVTHGACPPGGEQSNPAHHPGANGASYRFVKCGITSLPSQASCSSITALGVPMLLDRCTYSRPGYFVSSVRRYAI